MGSQFYASRDRPSLGRSNNHRQHFRRRPLGGFTGGQSSGPSEGSFHLKSSFDCQILNRSPKTFKFGMCSTFHIYFELTFWKFWFRKNLFTNVVQILIFTKMAKWRGAANFSECCLWSDPFLTGMLKSDPLTGQPSSPTEKQVNQIQQLIKLVNKNLTLILLSLFQLPTPFQ